MKYLIFTFIFILHFRQHVLQIKTNKISFQRQQFWLIIVTKNCTNKRVDAISLNKYKLFVLIMT